MSQAEMRAIISGAYDAAFDDSLWEPWSHTITSMLGGAGGTFFVLNSVNQQIESMVNCWGKTAGIIDEYMEGWWQFDPQMSAACGLRNTAVYLDTDYVDLACRDTASYMDWQREKGGFDHHMTAVVILPQDRRVGISIHRATQSSYTPTSEYRKLAAMFPEISRAMRLGYQHSDMLQTAFWDGVIVGKVGQMALLLDETGRVIRHSDAAHRLVALRDGLDILAGRVRSLRPDDDAALQSIIGQAIDPISPRSGAASVSRPSGKHPLILVCYPLPRTSRMLAPAEAAALLTIIDPSIRLCNATSLYRQIFHLTAREAEIANALAVGHSVESAAAMLEMTMPTARTHMRRIFEKTGTSGQTSLIRLLGRINAIVR